MGLSIDSAQVLDGLKRLYTVIPRNLNAAADSVAADIEATAKQNAPWTDRTGNARRTMTGFRLWENESTLCIGIAGHMPYSPDLELSYGGRYSILEPTMNDYSPVIMDQLVRSVIQEGGI